MKHPRLLVPVLVVASLLALAGCAPARNANAPTPKTDAAAAVKDDIYSAAPRADAVRSDTRIIDVEARNFDFSPATVQVKKGEKVALKITSTQGDHAFSIPDLGIGFQPVLEKETITVLVPTDRAGTFRTECGPMHPTMLGSLIVQ